MTHEETESTKSRKHGGESMNSEIEIQIKVPNQTRYLRLIGQIGENLVKEMCQLPNYKEICANNLNVVITEAMANAIKHADAAESDMLVKISVNISDNELSVKVYDSGQGFDLDSISKPDFNSDHLEESGRGIFVIRSLMDSVVYKKTNGWNVLEMKKSLAC